MTTALHRYVACHREVPPSPLLSIQPVTGSAQTHDGKVAGSELENKIPTFETSLLSTTHV